jgi:hypothetical protein
MTSEQWESMKNVRKKLTKSVFLMDFKPKDELAAKEIITSIDGLIKRWAAHMKIIEMNRMRYKRNKVWETNEICKETFQESGDRRESLYIETSQNRQWNLKKKETSAITESKTNDSNDLSTELSTIYNTKITDENMKKGDITIYNSLPYDFTDLFSSTLIESGEMDCDEPNKQPKKAFEFLDISIIKDENITEETSLRSENSTFDLQNEEDFDNIDMKMLKLHGELKSNHESWASIPLKSRNKETLVQEEVAISAVSGECEEEMEDFSPNSQFWTSAMS